MKKKLLILILFLCFIFIPNVKAEEIKVSYKTHVQDIGWMNYVKNGELSGTTGQSKRLEAIQLKLDNAPYSGNIEYKVHVQDIGWMNYVKNGELSGTTGQSKRLEAIQIKLTGDIAKYYDIEYRVHVQDIGWMDFVKNGELSGTTGQSKRLEAIEVKLTKIENSNQEEQYANLSYTSNVDGNWQEYKTDGISGTTGLSKGITGLKAKIDTNINGNIEYSVYQKNKWSNYSKNDETIGNLSNNIEAIKIRLTDQLLEKYDLYYRVHVQDFGWFDWVKNDIATGTIGYFYRIEAYEIKLLPKNSTEITMGNNYFKESKNTISYSSHVQDIGWMNYVNNGETSGTTGQGKRIESFKIKLNSNIGRIKYKSYVEKEGWQGSRYSDQDSGTTGKSRKIEAIKIELLDNLKNNYDIYYRTHVQDIGWLGWAKNGEAAGSVNNFTRIEAIEIKIVLKGSTAPGSTDKHYVTGSWKNNNTNYYTYFGQKLSGWQFIDGKKCFFNSKGEVKGIGVKKVIDVSSYQTVNWDVIKNDGDIDEAILRIGYGMSYDDAPGIDSSFDYNIKSVQRLNIPYSIYIYSYARVERAADKEARFTREMMEKYNIPKTTFVWYDVERDYDLGTYSTVIPRYVTQMQSNGYPNIGVYSSTSRFISGNLNNATIKSYPLWIAQYYHTLQYNGEYKGWQYASDGQVNGINTRVDMSMFK